MINTFEEFGKNGLITVLKHKTGGEDLKIAYGTDDFLIASNGEVYNINILEEYDVLFQESLHKIRGFEPVADEFRQHKDIIIEMPRRADVGSCAYDWYCPVDITIKPNEQVLIWSDIKAYMQQDEVLIGNVRSSQGKIRIQLANTQAWIDSTYYNSKYNNGNIGIFIRNEGTEDYVIKKGDRVMQTMFIKYLITDSDNPINKTRVGGFGSSGV